MKYFRNFFLSFLFLCTSSLFSLGVNEVTGVSGNALGVKVIINNANQGLMIWNIRKGGVQFSVYDNRQLLFLSAKTLSSSGGSAQLALNNNGIAIISWIEGGNIKYVQYNTNTNTLGTIQQINSADGAAANLTLAMNDNNQAMMAWNTGGGQTGGVIEYTYYTYSSGLFEATQSIGSSVDGNYAPKIQLNLSNFAMLVWNLNGADGGDIQFSTKSSGSDTFSSASSIPSQADASGYFPILTLNNSGTSATAWTSTVQVAEPGSLLPVTFYINYSVYPSFSDFSTLNTVSGIRVAGDIILNNDNVGILSFIVVQLHLDSIQDAQDPNFSQANAVETFLGYSIYNPGTESFGPPQIIPGTERISYIPKIALNQNSQGFMGWNTGPSQTGGNIQFSFFNKNQSSFGSILTIPASSAYNPSLTFNNQSYGAIGWNTGGETGGGIQYVLLNPLSGLFMYSGKNKLRIERGLPL